MRELARINPLQHQIAIGHRQRAAFAVAGRAGVRARAFRADPQARSIEAADGAAARRDSMHLHHRRCDTHARHHAVAGAFIFARIMADIGAGAAHVETDQARVTKPLCCLDHAHHAASRTGQHRILPAEGMGIGKAAIGLHEPQGAVIGQALRQLLDIVPNDGREIGIGHTCVAARDQPDERRDFVTGADLCEAKLPRDLCHLGLMLGEGPAMQQYNGERVDALLAQSRKVTPRSFFIERLQHFARRAHALGDFHHMPLKPLGQNDMASEDIRARLVADPQRVTVPGSDRKRDLCALPFQQSIGGNRRANPQLCDLPFSVLGQNAPHGFACGIGIKLWIAGQQFGCHQLPARQLSNDIGKGPAAINRKTIRIGHGPVSRPRNLSSRALDDAA